MQEIWKPVPGYEGLYEVSNLGRVRGLKRNSLRVLCQNSADYLVVKLWKNNKGQTMHVHRLVAEAFCEKPEGKNVIDHINNNKLDNRASNLRWVTQKENTRFSNSLRPVVRSDGKYYECIADVKEDGFNPCSVGACCRGRYKTSGGYTWAYVV